MINCNEIIEETKTVSTKTCPTNCKKLNCKTKKYIFYSPFYYLPVTLLINVVIYCYLIKYQVKQKYLLPYMSQIASSKWGGSKSLIKLKFYINNNNKKQ